MRELSDVFQVHFNSIARWVTRYRDTGSVDPAAHGGGRPRLIPEESRAVLRRLVEQQPDATLAELSERLKAKTGVAAATPRICEALIAMDLPRKKSRRTPANSTGPTSSSSARSSRSRKRGLTRKT